MCVCVWAHARVHALEHYIHHHDHPCLSQAYMPRAGGVIHVIHTDTSPTYSPVSSYAPYLLAYSCIP